MSTSSENKKILGPFALAMIAVVAIIDLRGLPMMASYGLSAIFVYGVAMILFLIPSGLVCAELSTNRQQPGGMYAWIRDAFGDGVGFVAMWLEWLNNVIGFPASLSFISVTLMYLFDPSLAHHKGVILGSTLTILWLTTFFILLGMKASSRLNMLGAVFGTILPALVIMILGFSWVVLGKPVQIELNWSHLIPTMATANPGIFAAIILGFGGMQIIAFHTTNAKNPGRDYPRAILAAIGIIFTVTLFSSVAVALVVPHQELNIISGLIDGFQRIFSAFHIAWATPLVVLLIVFSLLATLNAWFLGPARGLVVAAQNGFFPRLFAYNNRHDMPVNILLLQAVICTLLSTVFLYMPDISSGFWILLNLSSQSALIVYILIFAAGIRQRYIASPVVADGYIIPGGKFGMWLVAGIGIVTCVVALICSLIPPNNINTGGLIRYEAILIGSNAVFLSIPLGIIYYYSKRRLALSSRAISSAESSFCSVTVTK
jgi:amino acid transporter